MADPNTKEKQLSKPLTTLQIVLITIGSLIVLLVPLWVYMWHLSKNGISGEPEKWGQFGDFFGGVLNPIIALLTLGATVIIAVMLKKIDDRNRKKDRAINYMPDLFLDQPGFYAYIQQNYGGLKPVEFTVSTMGFLHRSPLQLPNAFGIKVYNVGLGSAKNVKLTFDINTAAIAALINDSQNAMPAAERINIIHQAMAVAGLVRFEYPVAWNHGPHQLIEVLNDTKRASRILSEGESGSSYLMLFPQYFLELYSCYLYAWNWWLQNNANQRPAFIPIHLNIEYQDIDNTTIKQKFKIDFKASTGGGSEYTNAIVVEQLEKKIEPKADA